MIGDFLRLTRSDPAGSREERLVRSRRALIPAAAAIIVLLAACGSDSNSSSSNNAGGSSATTASGGAATTAPATDEYGYPTGGGDTTAAGGGATTGASELVATGFAFTPDSVTAKAGTINVKNEDGTTHTFTSDDGKTFDVSVKGGDSATITVDTPGTYAFHCKIHSNMHGTLIVQ
jgi:plastocyanin